MLYDREFYANRHKSTAYAAETILSMLLARLPPVRSAVDVGCGVGTWLSVLRTNGAAIVHGIDGPWVSQRLLEIPASCFTCAELSKAFPPLPQKYDLAICLEVAEHLPEPRAESLVRYLTEAADCVLFGAAIPSQGGTGHVNEQWQSYWVQKFSDVGFAAHDFVRAQIWSDNQIPWWYRQNILVFAQPSLPVRLGPSTGRTASLPWDLVHPQLFLLKEDPEKFGVKRTAGLLKNALGKALRRFAKLN